MKKRISDTYLYQALELDNYIKNISDVTQNPSKAVLETAHLDQLTNEIRYKINFSTKMSILNRIHSGKMVIINKENLYLPAWVTGSPGKVDKVFVNVFGKVKVKDSTSMVFNPREIFAICQIGYFLEKFQENEARILHNQTIINTSMEIYMRLFFRVIDTIYSVDSHSGQAMVIRFLINKFFLIYLMEKDNNEGLNEIAFRPLKSLDNLGRLRTAIGSEDPAMYTSLTEFFRILPNYAPILKDLDLAAFLRKFLLLYGEKSLLALENLNMFLAIISSSVIAGGYIRDFAVEQFLGKEAISMYNTFIDTTKDN